MLRSVPGLVFCTLCVSVQVTNSSLKLCVWRIRSRRTSGRCTKTYTGDALSGRVELLKSTWMESILGCWQAHTPPPAMITAPRDLLPRAHIRLAVSLSFASPASTRSHWPLQGLGHTVIRPGCLICRHNQQELLLVHIWISDSPVPGEIPITQVPWCLLVPCGLIMSALGTWGSPEGGPWL